MARGQVQPPQPTRLQRAGRAIARFFGLRTAASDLLKPPSAAPRKKSGGGGARK